MNENDHSAAPGPEHTGSGHTGARRRRRPRRRVTRPAGSLAVSFSDGTSSDAPSSARNHSPAGTEGRSELAAEEHSEPGTEGHSSEDNDHSSPRAELESALHDLPSKEAAPFAAVSISTSGIHPKTSRLVALSVVFFGPGAEAPGDVANADELPTINIGQEVGALTRHLNPGEDAGPWHLHGYQVNELSQALGFNSSAQLIHQALDGRTLIMHESDYVWGFITHEFKLSQRSANRGRRSRGRGRGGRRQPTPAPVSIIDTLATARRQAIDSTDPRLRAIVTSYNRAADTAAGDSATGANAPATADSTTEPATSANAPANASRSAVLAPAAALPEVGAAASLSKKDIDPDELLEANARLTAALALAQQRNGELTVLDPEDLAADQFGLRRSGLRIDAANSPRPYVNPGAWKRGEPLVEGMEFVVSPDVEVDPDVLIGQGVAAGLAYSEKLNRRSSLVVCNENYELRGKAMHADRKNIPLIRDEDFLALLNNVQPGEKEAVPTKPGADARPRTSGLAGPRGGSGGSGGRSNSGGSNSNGPGGSGSGANKSNHSGNSGDSSNSQGHDQGKSRGSHSSGGQKGKIPGPSNKRNRRRRRRRKGSGGSGGSGGSDSSRGKNGSGGSGGKNNGGGNRGSKSNSH
ncbi:DNA polymerase III subunit epsilon [Corynebacterium jeikeium]|uniref:DNA polymerase III subunit epsilon n=1 Tax=Corynebacterium jeikeium TaxID=38289 RepID=UPI000DA29BF2|nr:DNA polymerase III subunit epsilon [Corynebacterium jeikeium]SQI19029.1 DNA polymerase III subunit epsilon [Corynebacterium jeikeium]